MPVASFPVVSRGRDKHVIALVVVPDSVAMEVAIAQEVFGRRYPLLAKVTGVEDSPYEVVLCGETPRQLLSSGMEFGSLGALDTILTADSVLIPGVEDPLAPRSEALLSNLRRAHDSGTRMVSFCGGAFVLGRAGILDGRRASTHWLLEKEFRAEFPLARLESESLYVDDGSVHTSGGFFSATDLALHIIALDLGQAYANDLSRVLVSAPHRPGGQAQFVKNSIRVVEWPIAGSFLHWLREHLDEPLTLTHLARHEQMSERSLIRKFRQETGMSVFDWISRERVDRAKELLETTNFRVADVAQMVGFGSAEALRRNFEKSVGTTAAQYRSTFRNGTLTTN